MGNVECKLVASTARDTVRMTDVCEILEVRSGFNTCQHYMFRQTVKDAGLPDVTDICRRAIASRGALPPDELLARGGLG